MFDSRRSFGCGAIIPCPQSRVKPPKNLSIALKSPRSYGYIYPRDSPTLGVRYADTSSQVLQRLPIREFSSRVPSDTQNKSIQSSTPADPPATVLPVTPSKTRKVDLHPAPKKSSSISEFTAASSLTPSSSSIIDPSRSPSSKLPMKSTRLIPDDKLPATSPSSSSHPSNPKSRNALEQARLVFTSELRGVLAPPPEGSGRVARLIHQAKGLFKFYWGGLKAQWYHHKIVNDIKRRVKEEKAAGNHKGMTRWETQFIRTHQRDLVKYVSQPLGV